MKNQKSRKASSQISHRWIFLLAIVLTISSCQHQKARPTPAKESIPVNPKNLSLQLKFTSGVGVIFEDSKGNYWFGSHQEGACLFDGSSLEYFTTNEGLPDNQIRSIQEDKQGNIWLGTARGVSSYDGERITQHTPIENENTTNEWMKTDHDLWFNAGNKAGVYRYDGQKLAYLPFPNPKIINPNNVYHVTSFSKGKKDMLWIGTYAGIFGYDGKEFTIINDQSLGLKTIKGQLHIRSLLEDSQGRLWIGNNGIGVLLKDKRNLINFSEKKKLIHLASSRGGDRSPAGTLEHVFAIEEDADGNIWFGDRDTGLWRYDGKKLKNYSKEDGLTDNFVLAIYQDKKDKLWLGLADGQVFTFNGQTFEQQF